MHGGSGLDGFLAMVLVVGAALGLFALLGSVYFGFYFYARWKNKTTTPIPDRVMVFLVPVALMDALAFFALLDFLGLDYIWSLLLFL